MEVTRESSEIDSTDHANDLQGLAEKIEEQEMQETDLMKTEEVLGFVAREDICFGGVVRR